MTSNTDINFTNYNLTLDYNNSHTIKLDDVVIPGGVITVPAALLGYSNSLLNYSMQYDPSKWSIGAGNIVDYNYIQTEEKTPEPEETQDNSITLEEVLTLANIQKKLYNQSKQMGWHNKPRDFGTMIALCHSELSEALEGARKDLWDDHLTNRPMSEVELADCIIRILDLAGREGYDVAGALAEKHEYNRTRADHQLKNREAEGGKKF
jgi:hypothetical protein